MLKTNNIAVRCILITLLFTYSCKKKDHKVNLEAIMPNVVQLVLNEYEIAKNKLDSLFKKTPEFISTTFDFPVGKPNAQGYYNAQEFGENFHLGDDWSGVGGGNTDLGDPIYSISNGYISTTENIGSSWGNVIRIIHLFKDFYYESLYAHCDTIVVKPERFIKRGEQIGTIGNANGIYLAHLHLEIRDSIFMDIGGGYAQDTLGYINPTAFIKSN